MMAKQNIYKAMICFGYIIVSESVFRWDTKTRTVYGQVATLSCNGIGCKPTSIRKWIGGPTSDVLCFNEYSSNPDKYQLVYNKTNTSFDLMIKSFNFADTNCTYTCACGFQQFTRVLKLDEIDFVYPPYKELKSETKVNEGKFQIDIFLKVYPLPKCTVFYENIISPIETTIIDIQEEFGIKLYRLKLEYILNVVENQNCRGNLTLSCKVRSLEFPLLQRKLDLCKDTKINNLIWTLLGIVCGSVIIALLVIYVQKRRRRRREYCCEVTNKPPESLINHCNAID